MNFFNRCTSRKALDASEGLALDAGVWGKLWEHIPLQAVYDKLPRGDFLRLRLVCKEWDYAALQRLVPEPYSVTIQKDMVSDKCEDIVNGVLSYDVASKKFRYKCQQRPLLYRIVRDLAPFAVEGLIFYKYHRDTTSKYELGVFNIHTNTWHAIVPAPKRYSRWKSVYGLIVDTSERPYSFKLVVGSDTKTQIYDSKSRSWKVLSSQLRPLGAIALGSHLYVTCICSHGILYISVGARCVLMYSIKGDVWTSLDFPYVNKIENRNLAAYFDGLATHALGIWEGRIFSSRDESGKGTVTVWELVHQKWVEYASMPEEYKCLLECFDPHPGPYFVGMVIVPRFCNGYLLIYNWQYESHKVESLVTFNLATKEWKLVDLPIGTVAV